MTEKTQRTCATTASKEEDICTACAYAAISLTNLGDKVRELRHVPNLGSNMCFVL
jgi:hypothetical protein